MKAEQAQCTQLIVMFTATARKLITVAAVVFFTTLFVFDSYLNLGLKCAPEKNDGEREKRDPHKNQFSEVGNLRKKKNTGD